MRRLLLATLVVLFSFGCGRSGPLAGIGGPRTLEVVSPPANAGTIAFGIGPDFDTFCPPTCGTFSFDAGSAISLEANEELGEFGTWSGDAGSSCGSVTPCTYYPRDDQVVSADFTAHLLVATSDGSLGSITSTPSGIDCPGLCENDFLFGSTVTLAAVATGSLLQGWGGACAGEAGSTCSFVLDEYRTAVAWFGLARVDLYGTPEDEWAEAVAVDPIVPGGYVLAGSFTSPTLVLGSSLVPHDSGQDLFVARFGADRRVTWLETVGGGGDIRPHGLAVDEQDGVLSCYLGGSFEGNAQFDGMNDESPTGDTNGFVSKHLDDLADVPTPEWFEVIAGADADSDSQVADVAFRNGRVALTGFHSGMVTFAGTTLSSSATGNRRHAHDAVFTSAGVLGFVVQHGRAGSSHAESASIVFAPTGETLSAGFRNDTIDDGGPCTDGTNPNTDYDAWFYELGATGATCTPNTVTLLRPTGENRWSSLASGPSGAFLAVGYTRTLDLSVTVSEYSAAGAVVWTKDFPASAIPGPWAAAYHVASDQWVLAGSFEGQLVVGGLPYDSAGLRDVLVFRMDRTGNVPKPAMVIGGSGNDVVGGPAITGAADFFLFQDGHAASALAVLDDGTALVAGWSDSPELGSGPFKTPNAGGMDGTADLFVIHVLPTPD